MHLSRWATETSAQHPAYQDGYYTQSLFYPSRPIVIPQLVDYSDTGSTNMTICGFYQRGACKFGDSCKYEHPGSQRDSRGGFGGFGGNANSNRFNALGGGGDRYRPAQQSGGAFGARRDTTTPRFHLDKDDIKTDLSSQRPIYPLSCYGPGREAPRQLIEGPVEISPEELRHRYYTQRTSGSEAAAVQEESQLLAKVEEQVKTILGDLQGAIKYVEDGADVHPNRLDIMQGKVDPSISANTSDSNPFSKPPANPFGTAQAPTPTPAFGQASTPAFGQASTPAFGRPALSAFGQLSNPGQTTSAFGQPSNPGQTSAFGQASAFGKPSVPGAGAFGQPSTLGGSAAFGQGSAFGKPSLPGASSAFGQPSAPGAASAFGKPSVPGAIPAFGQPSAPGSTSAFGKPSMPGQTSAFGQTSGLGQPSAFGKPAFGQSGFSQTSQPGPTASPFGQQVQATQASPFGQQTASPQAANPFAKPTEQQKPSPANPFEGAGSSQSSGFSTTSSPFARAQAQSAPAQTANPFAMAKPSNAPAASSSPFGAATKQANPFGQPQPAQPQAQAQSTIQTGIHPTTGKPIDAKDRFKEGKPEEYEGEQGKRLEDIYKRVAQLGFFDENTDIPLIPPKCEWIEPVLLGHPS